MSKQEPSKQAAMQYLFLSRSFFNLICVIAFIAVTHQLLVHPFFPEVWLELLTGGVMIGVVLIGAPVAFVKARRDARRLCLVETTPDTPQNQQS